MAEAIDTAKQRKTLQGTVISDKMEKTRVVQIKWLSKHSKYHKVVRKASKFKAHDEKNVSKTGDLVRIIESRPLSKTKRWTIIDVVEAK